MVYSPATRLLTHLEHTARFLVGLGCPFTVRQPPELLAALEALATRITHTVAQQG